MFHREKIDTKNSRREFLSDCIESMNSGIKRRQSQGKHGGRASKINCSQIAIVSLLRRKGDSIRDVAKTCALGIGSCYKILVRTGATAQH